ncbi:down syndrome cell adhesion molecule-like protein [Trichonephila clavata]|uniref:Down syndrome cell adhesion molecule-like protein n=1 Tax=Trichonephila clavata TaxID=2740835 RepID=A0A8X6JJU5_TRICU|nr:down syndrome cell adhesion molecule-like protein [Trichonephila clavata]
MAVSWFALSMILFTPSLSLNDVPQIGPFNFPGNIDVGMRASVQCAVMTGEPPFQFSWFKDGHKLADPHGISIGNFGDFISNLIISKVDANSNGNYTCKVSNSAGFDERSAVLSVKGVY